MFKLNMILFNTYIMSLSKKNLEKLNKYKKNKTLFNNSTNLTNYSKIDNNDNSTKKPLKSEEPNKIFYSLIDNSESLEETSNVNNLLMKSEFNQINMNSKNAHFSKKLTTEEELYDEFNYLLDE